MSGNHRKRKKHSYFYKIYRRVRYVRFLRKKRKNILKDLRKKEKEEKKEVRRKEREKRKLDRVYEIRKKEADKKKIKADVEELRQKHDLEAEAYREEKKKKEEQLKLKIEKDRYYMRRRRKRLLRYYLKLQRRNFARGIRSLNLNTLRKKIRSFREQSEKRKTSFLIFANSFSLFLLSYIVLYLVSQFATIIAALFFDFPTILYYWEIYFNISTAEWTPEAIKTVFTTGPLVSFIIGIISVIIYSNLKEYTSRFKLFFLWLFIHSITFFFGAILVGTLFEKGIGHTIGWLYIMDTGKVFYSIISIFIIMITGFIITRPVLFSANSYFTNLTRRNRKLFIHSQITIPYLAGIAVLILLREPRFMFYETFITFTAALILLPVLGTYNTYQDYYFEFEEKKPAFPWITVIITLLILLAYRFGLAEGINIG